MKRPPPLQLNDKAVILSPSGKIDPPLVHDAAAVLREWGLLPVIGEHALGARGRFSGSVAERLTDLQKAFDDPKVRLILCARGGYGAMHLLNELDLTAMKRVPKWVVGYSDITALHALLQAHGIASVHGPMAQHLSREGADDPAVGYMRQLLQGEPVDYRLPVSALSSMNRRGSVSGRLFGGNLSLFCSLLGTPYGEIPHNGIFFMEDIGEYPYKIDRMIWQLKLSGLFGRLGGMIIGRFTDYEEDEQMYTPLLQSIHEMAEAYSFPLCFDFPVGHVKENYPLMMGERAELRVTDEGIFFRQ